MSEPARRAHPHAQRNTTHHTEHTTHHAQHTTHNTTQHTTHSTQHTQHTRHTQDTHNTHTTRTTPHGAHHRAHTTTQHNTTQHTTHRHRVIGRWSRDITAGLSGAPPPCDVRPAGTAAGPQISCDATAERAPSQRLAVARPTRPEVKSHEIAFLRFARKLISAWC